MGPEGPLGDRTDAEPPAPDSPASASEQPALMACCRGRSSEGSQEERLPATDPDTCPRPLRPEAHLQTRMRGGVSASPAAGTEPTLLGGRGPQGLRRECDTSSCTGKMSPVHRADFACHGPRAAARASCRRVTDPAQPPPCLCSTHEPLSQGDPGAGALSSPLTARGCGQHHAPCHLLGLL